LIDFNLKFIKLVKENEIFNTNRNEKLTQIKKINTQLTKYGLKKLPYDQEKIGLFLFDRIIGVKSSVISTSSNDQSKKDLIVNLLKKNNNLNVNEIRNFLNQTLLHVLCEYNDYELCDLLVKHGADCLIEDNYRQTPLMISVKRNHLNLVKLFIESIKQRFSTLNKKYRYNDSNLIDLLKSNEKCLSTWMQILHVSYYASTFGHFTILKYLFDSFNLFSEYLIIEEYSKSFYNDQNIFSELNPLHVSSYKANCEIIKFLLDKKFTKSNNLFINKPINRYRDSTPLEEAFKGYIFTILESDRSNKRLNSASYVATELIKKKFQNTINFLIEKGARFSKSFIINNELSKLLSQIFDGPNRDVDFLHFLTCCNYLFKFKLTEIFELEDDCDNKFVIICNEKTENNKKLLKVCFDKQEFNLIEMIDEFIIQVYLNCLKVIKDYKGACLMQYVEIVLNLHHSGQIFLDMNKYDYLKDRNSELYSIINEKSKNKLLLKTLSSIAIRNSIQKFGMNKINQLEIPGVLKKEIFDSSCTKISTENFICFPYLI
jgi:hypothetical protein